MKPALRVFYISNFQMSGQASPSVNERQFVHTLESKFPGKGYFYLPEGPSEIPLPKERTTFFPEPPHYFKPISRLKYALKWARRARDLFVKSNSDVIVIRLGANPLKEYFLAKMLPGKVFVKSLGLYKHQGKPANIIDRVLRGFHARICENFFRKCAGVEAVTPGYVLLCNGLVSHRKIFL